MWKTTQARETLRKNSHEMECEGRRQSPALAAPQTVSVLNTVLLAHEQMTYNVQGWCQGLILSYLSTTDGVFFRLRNSFLYLTSSFNEWYFTLSNYSEWHYFFLLHSSWWRVFNVFLMFVCGDNFNLFLLLGRHSLEKENTRWVLLRQANCPVGKLERYLKEK